MPNRTLITWILLSTSSLANCMTPAVAEDFAFLVAVQDYDVKQLTPLKYSRNDILEFHKLLLSSGYDKDNVVVMHDDMKRLDNRRFIPEASRIRHELKLLLSTLEPDDSIIVALAGHGVQFKGEKENYFCPADTDLAHDNRKSLLAINEVYRALEKTPARRRLLLVDACRNDPQSGLSRSLSNVRLESVTRPQITSPPKGVVALFSCSEGQRAFEWPNLKHGIFFYHVLQAWKHPHEELTLDHLVASTKSKTKRFARLNLSTLQSPEQKGFFPGEWILRSQVNRDLVSNSIGMQLKLIRAGEFMMGSPDSDINRSDYERPHKVRITKPFYLQTTEVTRKQWTSVMGTTPWKMKLYSYQSSPKVPAGDDFPVTQVSWHDAQDFITRLNRKENRTYRLPTEAEWEYACRAGSQSAFCFGDNESSLQDYAWFDQNAYKVKQHYCHRVMQKRPNPWGLYDMHGNVWEWCSDRHGDKQTKRFVFGTTTDPQGPPTGSRRINRGGGWTSFARQCQSNVLDSDSPEMKSYALGFRLVQVHQE